jgi:hypothetical protein
MMEPTRAAAAAVKKPLIECGETAAADFETEAVLRVAVEVVLVFPAGGPTALVGGMGAVLPEPLPEPAVVFVALALPRGVRVGAASP